ncbi:hypothetical protein HYV85_03060 [Candidatus Woesearchaeota archaeon]|nr:hypothetical protein [Candidatus Woesearchaeota archaeon]
MDYGFQGAADQGSMYQQAKPRNMRSDRASAKAFLTAVFVIVLVALIVTMLFLKLNPTLEKQDELPQVSSDQLVFTSPTDADQQAEVRSLTGYDWAVLLNTPLDDANAMLAVPYLTTLELEIAVAQHQLLNSSERYVSAETLQLLNNDSSLKGVMENLAAIEEAYYSLGLPSGTAHAERLRHLGRRLEVYGPPLGEVRDSETRLFVQEHLGFAVDTFNAWYALIRLKHDRLLHNIEKTKDKKSVLTVEDYLGKAAEGKRERLDFVK